MPLQVPEQASIATPWQLPLVGAAGFGLSGLVIARLTLGLNPQVQADPRDTVVLLALFLSVYAAVGGAAGLVAALLARALPPIAPRLRAAAVLAGGGVLLASPLLYVALLPDVGLAPRLLTRVLLGGSAAYSLAVLALAGLVSAVAGGAVLVSLHRLRRHLGRGRPALLVALWLVAAAVIALPPLLRRPESVAAEARPMPRRPREAGATQPRPVVLLCVDGADPDDVLEPLMARGELPTFARLRESGVWSELETLVPALSPAIWTTLVTGKAPGEHGIHHFVYFELPGLRHPVLSFPLHTGLNFRLFPLLERLPGRPTLRRPYTSDMRRVPALWTIVGERHVVGVYRWRATWPAEEVHGFNLAAGVALLEPGDWEQEGRGGSSSAYPVSVLRLLASARPPVSDAEVSRYLGPARRDEVAPALLREIERALEDPAVRDLSILWRHFHPRFLAAAFFSVDGFQHHFARARGTGGPFSPAVEERYRQLDARLGQLLRTLGPAVNLLVVSDHGFDFERNNHAHGPPGLFLAHGPAFRRGVEVEGLSVFDVAPLVLRLLGLPLARDMPGTERGMDREVLTPETLKELPRLLVSTYGTRGGGVLHPVTDPRIEETKERLKALGYID